MAKGRRSSVGTKVEKMVMGAVPVIAGVVGAGLLFRYGGDLPIIKDALKGHKGDVAGKLFG